MSTSQAASAQATRRPRKKGPPPYDPAAVGRVARHVEIVGVELLGAHFERQDDDALPQAAPADAAPDFGIGVDWALSEGGDGLGVVLTFATMFDGDDAPYELVARFRLTYSLGEAPDLPTSDIEQFAHWNATFNAWPYWREYLSSTLNRAQLARFVVPVMAVPMPEPPTANS